MTFPVAAGAVGVAGSKLGDFADRLADRRQHEETARDPSESMAGVTLLTIPQARRSPELPLGSFSSSSGWLWTINAVPRHESASFEQP
jgi:hypothetical protein